jgi:hypothetical protein
MTAHLHLLSKLRTSGAITPLYHVIIAWCLIYYGQGNIYLLLYYKKHLPATRVYDGSAQQVFIP